SVINYRKMSSNFILSDNEIRIICITIGALSFVINTLCIYLIIYFRRIFASNIFVVTFLLQAFNLAQNLLFNVLFTLFIHAKYGGGYCIGFVCDSHILPFWAFYSCYILLSCSIAGLFVLLIFFRHQTLLSPTSMLKLSRLSTITFSAFLMLGVTIIPVHYTSMNVQWTRMIANRSFVRCVLHAIGSNMATTLGFSENLQPK
ncbi:hypothetical protein PENTCL1PPCAC_16643, partial [Pristionchus entomophagus]